MGDSRATCAADCAAFVIAPPAKWNCCVDTDQRRRICYIRMESIPNDPPNIATYWPGMPTTNIWNGKTRFCVAADVVV